MTSLDDRERPDAPVVYLVETIIRDEYGDVALYHDGAEMRTTLAILGPPRADLEALHEAWRATLPPRRRRPRWAYEFLKWLHTQPGWYYPYVHGRYSWEHEDMEPALGQTPQCRLGR